VLSFLYSGNTTLFVFQLPTGGLVKNLTIQSLCALMLICSVGMAQTQLDSALFAGMKACSIGLAGMSGRIGGIDAVISNADIIYVGSATGGVWKTTNGGTTWIPVFDTQPVTDIGSVVIFQPSPATVWVGTGKTLSFP
jgi:photosystem II stability/assembly factor-like uncharacterized protein